MKIKENLLKFTSGQASKSNCPFQFPFPSNFSSTPHKLSHPSLPSSHRKFSSDKNFCAHFPVSFWIFDYRRPGWMELRAEWATSWIINSISIFTENFSAKLPALESFSSRLSILHKNFPAFLSLNPVMVDFCCWMWKIVIKMYTDRKVVIDFFTLLPSATDKFSPFNEATLCLFRKLSNQFFFGSLNFVAW